MTPKAKELVERLRDRTFSRWESDIQDVMDYDDEDATAAADLITQQDARIEELERRMRMIAATADGGHANGHWHGVCYKIAMEYLMGRPAKLSEKDIATISRNLPRGQQIARSVLGGKNGR